MLTLSCIALACSSDGDRTAASSSPVTPSEPPANKAPSATGLNFREQPGWKPETAANPTRKAQFTLPRVDPDTEDASLIVYYFGAGQGGSREANFDRWASQFEQSDGTSSRDRLQFSTRKVSGLDVTDVALEGTFVAETTPGSGTRVHKERWRMLASIVETEHGPYYIKLVGPGATVTHWESSYRRFISEIEPAR